MKYEFHHDHGTCIRVVLTTEEGYDFIIPSDCFDIKTILKNYNFDVRNYIINRLKMGGDPEKVYQDARARAESINKVKLAL